MALLRALLLLLLGVAAACQSNGVTALPVSLAWEVPGRMTTEVCAPFTLAVSHLESTLKITLGGLDNARAYFTAVGCAANLDATVTHMTLPSDTTLVRLYVRDPVAEILRVTASGPGVDSVQSAVVVDEFSVLGQPDVNTDVGARQGLAAPQGVFVVGDRLLLADTDHGRVLIWNGSAPENEAPSLVLGQANLDTLNLPDPLLDALDGSVMRPISVWSDGTRLLVGDAALQRVLVWNTFPTRNNQPADFALGRPAGASNLTAPPRASPVAAADTLLCPAGVYSDGTRLYVADACFNRVLVWNSMPTTGGTPADFALGQAAGAENLSAAASAENLSAAAGAENLSTLAAPSGVWGAGGRLWVADSGHGRVLVWNAAPRAGGQAADYALGPPNGAPGSMQPTQITSAGERLLVSDSAAHRVLVWNSLPMAAGILPDNALGQPAGADNLTSQANTLLQTPQVASNSNGNALWISDAARGRLLGWATFPAPGEAPTFVWGAPNLPSATRFVPNSVASNGDTLLVGDSAACRVLVWNSMPHLSNTPADFALGVPANANNLLQAGDCGASATSFNPAALWIEGQRLLVADADHHRVLVWNALPRRGDTPADFALGQPAGPDNLTSTASSAGHPSAGSMGTPVGVAVAQGALYVVDSTDNRVLMWNSVPNQGGVPADFVLGQPSGTASGLNSPSGIAAAGGHLFVADTGNARVLVWSSPPLGVMPPDFALGVPAGIDNLSIDGAEIESAPTEEITAPLSVFSDGRRLVVGDVHRLLVWTGLPTFGGQAADVVLGKMDPQALSELPLGANTLDRNSGIWGDSSRLFVADAAHGRLLVLPFPH